MTTLLAVDDSNTMRKVMEITFAGEDFRTVLAANSNQAMEQLQQSGATVAVVDSGLEGNSGYDLCQRIKGASPQTRVLLLSSKQNPFDPGRGAAAGADDHMDKPFDTQTMIDRVRALVSGASRAVQAPVAAAPVAARAVVPQPPAAIPVPIPRSSPMASPVAQAAPHAQAAPAPTAISEIPDAVTIEPAAPAQAQPVVVPSAPRVPAAAPVAAVAAGAPASARANGSIASLEGRLAGLGLTADQVASVLQLSREVIEQAVWEVVPTLAETLIKEEIARLTK